MPASCTSEGKVFDLPSPSDVLSTIELLNRGLPAACFERLSEVTEVNEKDLAGMVRISPRTIYRRKREGFFPAEEGERILRLMRIMERAVELFGDREKANQWLKKPKKLFEGKTPLAFAETEPGAQFVLQVIGRIEHGVFS